MTDHEREDGQHDSHDNGGGNGRTFVVPEGGERRKKSHYARSETFSPISPEGRKISTQIKTKKAKMS